MDLINIKKFLKYCYANNFFKDTCKRLLDIKNDYLFLEEFKNIFPSIIYNMILSPIEFIELLPLYVSSDNLSIKFTAMYLIDNLWDINMLKKCPVCNQDFTEKNSVLREFFSTKGFPVKVSGHYDYINGGQDKLFVDDSKEGILRNNTVELDLGYIDEGDCCKKCTLELIDHEKISKAFLCSCEYMMTLLSEVTGVAAKIIKYRIEKHPDPVTSPKDRKEILLHL
jgi:hypothetical protein